MKYTSEYIPKLQLHKQSILTRKVFSRHNSSAKVFIIGSSSMLNHHCIIIKFGSLLDYHQRWIITGSSSKLDHHWIIIITAYAILIKWFYLSILLITGSSTEPTLFHAGCRPSLHVGLHLLQHLYLTMGGTHPPPCQKDAQHSHPSTW